MRVMSFPHCAHLFGPICSRTHNFEDSPNNVERLLRKTWRLDVAKKFYCSIEKLHLSTQNARVSKNPKTF